VREWEIGWGRKVLESKRREGGGGGGGGGERMGRGGVSEYRAA